MSHNTETVWGGLRAGGEEGRINATTETHMNEHKTSARSIFQGKECRVIHVYDQKVCNTIQTKEWVPNCENVRGVTQLLGIRTWSTYKNEQK